MSDEITELFGPGLAEITGHPQRNRRGACGRSRSGGRARVPRSCSISAGWSTRRACTTRSPRCRASGGPIPGTTLTIAGDGTQYEWLVEQARKHKVLKAVTFVGRVDHKGLVQLLHSADAAVLPSHYEPFGIVALEAAATGAPLVTSNVGGLGEAVINGQTGMSFPPRDIAALAAAVRAVLDDPAGGATACDRRAGTADVRLRLAHGRGRNRAGVPGRQTR